MNKIVFSFMILLGCASLAFGQPIKKKDVEKKTKEANELFDFGDYQNALNIYKELLKIDSTDHAMIFRTGVCMFNLRKHRPGSISYFEKAAQGGIAESHYFIGLLEHLRHRFDVAIDHFGKYSNSNKLYAVNDSTLEYLKRSSAFAKKMMLNKVNVTIENVGSAINSAYPDYVPLISADESVMIFTSRRPNSTGGQVDAYGDYFEDIYISRKGPDGWPTPVGISKNLNTDGHDACVALSPDGEQLIIYRTSEDLMAGDLYISNFTGKDWTVPVLLGSDINTEEGVEPSASFSADNQSLYFVSNRFGGKGGKDIYRVVKLPDNTWSKASNLGSVLNTPYDEDAPFMHPDGKTLYFSSKGHNTMGGFDIFRTRFDEENNTWEEPENLGHPLNTVDNDIYFVLSADGAHGYYSSQRPGGFGETDLYRLNMPASDFKVQAFNGAVMSETNEPVTAKITVVEAGNNDMVGVYRTNKVTGKYLMILSPIKNYTYTIEAPGFETATGNLDFSKGTFITKLQRLQNN